MSINKTLEEIESYHGEYDKVRDAAIEHYKTLIGEGWDEGVICRWIKHFFNLNEEDLKE